MSRRRQKADLTCSRCTNESDLRQWYDGNVYCAICMTCAHGASRQINEVCICCLQQLHTTMTFHGPRIRDIEVYVHDAYWEYGLRAYHLLTCSFEEEEEIEAVWDTARFGPEGHPPTCAPPHHRF